jgi:hypothetical protein
MRGTVSDSPQNLKKKHFYFFPQNILERNPGNEIRDRENSTRTESSFELKSGQEINPLPPSNNFCVVSRYGGGANIA